MLISYCVPCMNRTYDLKKALPTVIRAAQYSPPVEIVIVDYNSQDELAEYIKTVDYRYITYKKYSARDHFHMAHARNLTIRAAHGEYIVISCADILMNKEYFFVLRELLSKGNIWLHHHERFVGVICCQRQELIESGGFDERFEFYGKEDKDLILRLKRRNKKHQEIPRRDLLSLLPTPWPDKLKNYRGNLTRREMSKRSKRIYNENIENAVTVVNVGKEWGQWN